MGWIFSSHITSFTQLCWCWVPVQLGRGHAPPLRSILEFWNVTWCPHFICLNDQIEALQRRFTHLFLNLRFLLYTKTSSAKATVSLFVLGVYITNRYFYSKSLMDSLPQILLTIYFSYSRRYESPLLLYAWLSSIFFPFPLYFFIELTSRKTEK